MEATATYRRDKNNALAWIAAALATAAIGAAGFAHGKLWSHEVAIERQAERQTGQEKRLDGIDGKLDRILEELRRHP